MWDGLLVLILLCIALAASSFLVGLLPLSLSLSSRKLRLISSLGTGVLVGTALIVIIPEGIETLYSASGSTHSHPERSISVLRAREAGARTFPGSLKHDIWRRHNLALPFENDADSDACIHLRKRQDDGTDDRPDTTDPSHEEDQPSEGNPDFEHDEEATYDPHAWVGISLITGFVLMYLIDTLPRQATSTSQPQRFQISLNQFSLTRTRTSSVPETPTISSSSQQSGSSRPSSTTVGLVIHACADGIALGASSTTTSNLSFIIFVALMIHKAPAAFGLTSVLLKQGLSTRAARAHLIVFSLAAPLGALATWGAAHLLGYTSSAFEDSSSTEFATGVLLLFSGGTFLYVAMHTMQESGSHDHDGMQGNGYVGIPMAEIYGSAPSAAPKKDAGGVTDTFVCVIGMLIPLLLSFGHVHH